MTTEALSAYTHEFDQDAYDSLSVESSQARQQEQERLDLYTDKQLQTLLAERFNVLVSTFHYEMRDGRLWGENMNEPAIISFKRGRDLRRKQGNAVDFAREDSEIVGFEKIERMLSEEKDVLSISPKGGEESTYQHNYYDIFKWKNGRVEAKRYSSDLAPMEYGQVLNLNYNLTTEDLLANPVDVSDSFDSADQIHAFLHREHEYMDEETFNSIILPPTRSYRMGYLKALSEGDLYMQALNFNGMLNVADEVVSRHKNREQGEVYARSLEYSDEALWSWGTQDVREVRAGCGGSGGFKVNKFGASELSANKPFSVKEFGEEVGECETCNQSSADKHYHCPGCEKRFSDETSKSAEKRTKECGCGFKFGC